MSMNWYRDNGSDEWDSFVQACHEAMEDEPNEDNPETDEEEDSYSLEDEELEWIETRRNMIRVPETK